MLLLGKLQVILLIYLRLVLHNTEFFFLKVEVNTMCRGEVLSHAGKLTPLLETLLIIRE